MNRLLRRALAQGADQLLEFQVLYRILLAQLTRRLTRSISTGWCMWPGSPAGCTCCPWRRLGLGIPIGPLIPPPGCRVRLPSPSVLTAGTSTRRDSNRSTSSGAAAASARAAHGDVGEFARSSSERTLPRGRRRRWPGSSSGRGVPQISGRKGLECASSRSSHEL
jgi:hypothetical protein